MLWRCAVLAALIWLGLTSRAGATVSVVLGSSDPDAFYAVNDVITLTVRVTADGGAADDAIYGAVLYRSDVLQSGSQSFNVLPGGWNSGAVFCSFVPTARCIAINQTVPIGSPPLAPNVTDFLIAKLTFVIPFSPTPPPYGTVLDFTWQTTPSVQRLDFFGVTNAPGYSVTIVPEPTTAALLCVGLLGLVIATRRRA